MKLEALDPAPTVWVGSMSMSPSDLQSYESEEGPLDVNCTDIALFIQEKKIITGGLCSQRMFQQDVPIAQTTELVWMFV